MVFCDVNVELYVNYGSCRRRRIRNWILSEGDFFDFERLATEDEDGCINMSQLADDECVLSPGVIYKKRNCPCV